VFPNERPKSERLDREMAPVEREYITTLYGLQEKNKGSRRIGGTDIHLERMTSTRFVEESMLSSLV